MTTTVDLPVKAVGGHYLVRRTLGFVRLLRDNGFPVGQRETIDAVTVVRACELADRHELRWCFRALLCASTTDWRRFDDLFDAFWFDRGLKQGAVASEGARSGTPKQRQTETRTGAALGAPDRTERGPDVEADGDGGRRGGASAADSLTKKDLRYINDPEELALVYDLAERLAARMKYRLTRRERQRRRGRRLDLRRTIHNSIRFGGTPLRLAYRRRWPKPLRLVLILDASGSMSLYSAFFVRFVRGLLDHSREAEAFVFHTRLIHISSTLRERNVEKALDRMALVAAGWDGGTRIGESLATFNRNHASRVINTRTAVVIVSDGYDTGPADLLARELGSLRRRVKRLVWLNPMAGWGGYEPVAEGMAAALPHVDLFAQAHNLESLARLEPYLAKL